MPLTAYAVTGGEPLALTLTVTGRLADIGRLQQEGIYDDLITMAESVKAIPEKPGDSEPRRYLQ